MGKIDYDSLKRDLLNITGASGIMAAIVEVDSASKDKLLRLALRYGLDIQDYQDDLE